MSIEQVLSEAPVTSMDGAIRIMQAIDTALDATDGLRWFNHLYLRVTLSVDSAARSAQFLDPDFLRELDVVFANLYFSAVAIGCRLDFSVEYNHEGFVLVEDLVPFA